MDFTKENIKGRVINISHHFKRDENIMCITWWDGTTIRTNEVMENYTTDFYYVKRDITDELYKESQEFVRRHRERIDKINAEDKAKVIRKDVHVDVIKGKAKGHSGKIYAIYENPYDPLNPCLYILSDLDGSKQRTYLYNIDGAENWEAEYKPLRYHY